MSSPFAAPPPMPAASGLTSSDRLWSVLCHLSVFLGVGLFLPLVVYLVMRRDTPYVAEQAREALNFHISLLIYTVVCWLLIFVLIGMALMPIVLVFAAVVSVIAAIKASDGIHYRYPLCLRLVT